MEFKVQVGLKEYKVTASNAPIARATALARHKVKHPGSKSSAIVTAYKLKGKWHRI